MNLYVIKADITDLPVQAIVSSANRWLRPGGGVDGSICRAAGPDMDTALVRIGGCKVGSAVITRGYRLKAEFVIHAVGPDCRITLEPEEQDALLRSAYTSCLQIAQEHNLKSIAFSAISTGLYQFPITRACRIAVETVRSFDYAHEIEIYFVPFTDEMEIGYFNALNE